MLHSILRCQFHVHVVQHIVLKIILSTKVLQTCVPNHMCQPMLDSLPSCQPKCAPKLCHGGQPWHVATSWVLLHHIHDGHQMALQCCAHRWLLGSHNLDKSMVLGGPGLWKAMGRPHVSKPCHPWPGAPWAGTWPAGSWGASPCKAFPMAVNPGGWTWFGKHRVLAWY